MYVCILNLNDKLNTFAVHVKINTFQKINSEMPVFNQAAC